MLAREFVTHLLKSQFVYRKIDRPVGGIDYPEDMSYCLKGKFQIQGTGYLFVAEEPYEQVR